MYPVSDGFLRAVKSNTRKYYWTGTIVTRGGMTYEFGAKEIVKDSGYISRQCCGSTEIELGTVYAAEMGTITCRLLCDIVRVIWNVSAFSKENMGVYAFCFGGVFDCFMRSKNPGY